MENAKLKFQHSHFKCRLILTNQETILNVSRQMLYSVLSQNRVLMLHVFLPMLTEKYLGNRRVSGIRAPQFAQIAAHAKERW